MLEHDLDSAPHGFAELIRAVAFALPALEIVDSRIRGWDISIVDTVADNASCGLYVGSRPVPLSAWAPPAWGTRCTPPAGWPTRSAAGACRCGPAT